MTDHAPNRRRFRWSLRTMFVIVMGFACWLEWNVHQVHTRKQLIRWAGNKGVTFNELTAVNLHPPLEKRGAFAPLRGRSPQAKGIGWLRSTLLGDQPVEVIWIPGVWRNETEAVQISKVFPEAKIIIGEDR
jgi:ABC-type phosphate/phosphonate transport system permease subunit